MYLRESRQTRAGGSVLSDLQLDENIWDAEKGRAQVRIIYNGGRADEPQTCERLRPFARSILRRCAPEEIFAENRSWQLLDAWSYGDVYVLEQLWRRIGVGEVLREVWRPSSMTRLPFTSKSMSRIAASGETVTRASGRLPSQLSRPNRTVWQVTERSPDAAKRLKSLGISKSTPILKLAWAPRYTACVARAVTPRSGSGNRAHVSTGVKVGSEARRLMAANAATSLGCGETLLMHQACALSRKVILKGMREIHAGAAPGTD